MPTTYCVSFLANRNSAWSIGVTNTLLRRVWGHRTGSGSLHAAASHITRLVDAEECANAQDAIDRETQRKGWRRAKTVALIVAQNPEWRDLAA